MNKILDIFKRKEKAQLKDVKKLNIVFAVGYLAQGLLLLIFGGKFSIAVISGYLTHDTLLSSKDHNVLTSGVSELFGLDIKIFLVVMLALSALLHILFLTVYRKKYEAKLAKGNNSYTWLLLVVVNCYVLVAMALINGINELSSLLLMVTVSLFSIIFGAISIFGSIKDNNWLGKCLRVCTLLAVVIPWIVIAISMLGSLTLGGINLPGYLYVINISVLAIQALIIKNICLQKKAKGKWSNFMYGEKLTYALIFVLQTAMVWQIFMAML